MPVGSPAHDLSLTATDVAALGLKPVGEWQALTLPKVPGLIVVTNAFTDQGQRHWVRQCLERYPSQNSNRTNLHAHHPGTVTTDGGGLWARASKPDAVPPDKELLHRLRWTTLGFHYDWTRKIYTREAHSAFPEDLQRLCDTCSRLLGLGPYSAEAAIVNYYHERSTLAGHTDHSERNQSAPLFSFSFGLSAVFMIGGNTKQTVPVPLWLRSGDFVVMTAQARQAYHAVPKIVSNTLPPGLTDDGEAAWAPFHAYLSDARININVRSGVFGDAGDS
eukprot:m.120304 g.120304  ORF g.120304 m.120304 type:complete len:276 (-) comp16499_c0_seq1:21-848(-)